MADIMPPPIHPSRFPVPEWGATFWSRVEVAGQCWLWTMPLRNGYGQFSRGYQDWGAAGAHRIAYLWVNGSIPRGLVLDHLCRIRHCVNPKHLEPVTNAENVVRGKSVAAAWAARTECAEGHALAPYVSGVPRRCTPCDNEKARARRFKQPSQSSNTGPCSSCGHVRHVRVNGLLHRHRKAAGDVCPGSGQPSAGVAG